MQNAGRSGVFLKSREKNLKEDGTISTLGTA